MAASLESDPSSTTAAASALALAPASAAASGNGAERSARLPPSLTPIDHFISGISAGAGATLVLHPFDLIKTRMQMQVSSAADAAVPSSASASAVAAAPPSSSLSTARRVVRAEGWQSLWKGLSPNLVGSAAAWGSYFFLYEALKARLAEARDGALRPRDFLACACVTGAAVQALTNPIWVVKTRMFLDERPHGAQAARPSLLRALSALWREEGVRGLYRGFLPGLLGVSHGAVQFATYESVKQRLRQRKAARAASTQPQPQSTPPPFSPSETVLMAVVAKTAASVSTYPVQVIRTHMQSRAVDPPYASTWDCVRRVWRAGGLRGFYRGVVVGTVKVIPNACAVFVIYERVAHGLRKMAAERDGADARAAAVRAAAPVPAITGYREGCGE